MAKATPGKPCERPSPPGERSGARRVRRPHSWLAFAARWATPDRGVDSGRESRASDAQASASNAASISWSSGITTGSPRPVPPAALSAACVPESAQCVAVVSTACDWVMSDDPGCASSDRSWGASGRWFKSSRPDHLKAPSSLRSPEAAGPSLIVDAHRARRELDLLRNALGARTWSLQWGRRHDAGRP